MNYLITAIQRDFYGRYITHLRVQEEGNVATPRSWTKQEVIAAIEARRGTFNTMPPGGRRGARVNVISINGNKYLRTDSNSIPQDNLENLPEMQLS